MARDNTRPPSIEIVRLYRDVVKMTTRFNWNDNKGNSWREILSKTARVEFEEMIKEKDPLV